MTIRVEKDGGPAKGGYTDVWHCPQPEPPVSYRVLRFHWNGDFTERHVYEVEPLT